MARLAILRRHAGEIHRLIGFVQGNEIGLEHGDLFF